MKREKMLTIGIVGSVLSLGSAIVLAAQDKYTVRVPGGLAFSEFKGYETWQTISVSRNEKLMDVILGNPEMIDAYRAGFPGNGKAAPNGAKMAKSRDTLRDPLQQEELLDLRS